MIKVKCALIYNLPLGISLALHSDEEPEEFIREVNEKYPMTFNSNLIELVVEEDKDAFFELRSSMRNVVTRDNNLYIFARKEMALNYLENLMHENTGNLS